MTKNNAQIEQLYSAVFAGETARIPLIVTPPCPPAPDRRDMACDPAAHMQQFADSFAPKLKIGSDFIPPINVSWYQCIAIPSLFGAEPVYPEGSEPIVEPIFRNIEEAAAAGTPKLESEIIDQLFQTMESALDCLPEGFALSFPPSASPFDLAQILMPADEFMVSLIYDPDATARFLNNLADLAIELTSKVRKKLDGTISHNITNRGVPFNGFRLPSDSIVNMSPGLIEQFVLPIMERYAEAFGPLMIHYCSQPAPSHHILPVLAKSTAIKAVDTWQGPEAFIGANAPAPLQDKVALLFDVDLSSEEKMNEILSWPAIRDVPRIGGRAIVLGTTADSVDQGKEIYSMWEEKLSSSSR